MRELEIRLGNVIYRAGIAKTRPHARQLVNHGHVLVNKNKVDIPSYQVKINDTIEMVSDMQEDANYQRLMNERESIEVPAWIELKNKIATILRQPTKNDLHEQANYSYIIEFYR